MSVARMLRSPIISPRNRVPATPEAGPDSMVPTAFRQVASMSSTPP